MAFSYNASITNYPKKGLAHLRMFLIKRIRASVSKLTNSIWLTETLFPTSETMTAAIVMIVMTAMKTATTAMKMATVAMKMTGSYSNYDDPNNHDIGDIYSNDSNEPYGNEETHADPDMEIDEVPPSEDDRAAEVFLRFSQGNGFFHLQLQRLILCLIL